MTAPLCSLCEERPATTTWVFPTCEPCAAFLTKLDGDLAALEADDPELARIAGRSAATYRDRARAAIARRREGPTP